MNKYCFELYVFGDQGRVFKGYKTVMALNPEEAMTMVEEKVEDNIQILPVFLEAN